MSYITYSEMRKIILCSLLIVVLLLAFGGGAQPGVVPPLSIPLAAKPTSAMVIHDGKISEGEYSDRILIDGASNFYLHYSLNGSTIYFAMEAMKLGYLAIGFGYVSKMDQSDIYIGYVDGTGGHMSDNWGTGTISHVQDGTDNILSYAGSENATSTILEFSRALDTGDSTEDNVIALESTVNLIWAYSDTADDFTSYHTARGYATATFSKVAPSPPTNVVGTPGDGKVSLQWDDAMDGGSSITGYTVYMSQTSGSGYSVQGSGVTSPYEVTGLTNSQTYYFVVTATNVLGESVYSKEVSVIPSGTVTEPLNVISTPGRSQVDLSWDPPTSDGGSPITGYNVYRSEISGQSYVLLGGNTSALGYSDITPVNGITYYYVVTAKNIFMESAYSSEVSARPTGESVPPDNISTFLTDAETIAVNWSAPYTDGGYPITGYNVYRSQTSGGPYTFIGSNNTDFGFEDTSVVNLEIYYYVVTAVNGFGESKFSEESKIKVAKVPFAPVITSIESGFGYVNLTWSEPDDNGYNITSYNIYRSLSGSTSYGFIANTSARFFQDDLVANQEIYYYIVAAVNSQGEGKYSDPASILVGGVPRSPISLRVEISDSLVVLMWDAPLIDGGFDIFEYLVYRSLSADSGYSVIANTSELVYNDTDVVNGGVYYYRVSAVNSRGEGVASSPVSARPGVPPSAPLDLRATYDGVRVNLRWGAPLETSGYAVTGYLIYRSSDGGGVFLYLGDSNMTQYVDSSILKGLEYIYRVTALTQLGEGSPSNSTSIAAATIPERPLNLVGYQSGSDVVLQWTSPVFDGGSPVTGFNVYMFNGTSGNYTFVGNSTVQGYTIFNLTYGLNYTFVVTALNAYGESGYSSSFFIVIEATDSGSGGVVEFFFEFRDVFYTSAFFIGFGLLSGVTYLVTRLPKPNS